MKRLLPALLVASCTPAPPPPPQTPSAPTIPIEAPEPPEEPALPTASLHLTPQYDLLELSVPTALSARPHVDVVAAALPTDLVERYRAAMGEVGL